MADNSKDIMARAQSRFNDAQKKSAERKQAASEYESEAKARAAKTAKLKALRLAKVEADKLAVPANATPSKSKRPSVPKVVIKRGVGSM